MIRLAPTLSLYLIGRMTGSLVWVLCFVMGLIVLFDSVELLRRTAGQDGASVQVVVHLALLKLPFMVQTVLPFVVLAAALLTFWRLARSHELTVCRAAGVSVWEILLPVLAAVLVAGTINLAVVNPLVAALYGKFERIQDDILIRLSNPLSFSEGGLWLRETDESQTVVLRAGEAEQDGTGLRLRDVSIWEQDAEGGLRRRIEARGGILKDGAVRLHDVWMMRTGHASVFLEDYTRPSTLTLEGIRARFASPQTMSVWDLPGFIRFYEAAGFSALEHRLYWQSLLASPLLLCAMVLLAAVFALSPNQRRGGWLVRAAGAVLAGFVLFFFAQLTQALGLSQTLPMGLAAWSPAAVTTLLGISLLLHLEDG